MVFLRYVTFILYFLPALSFLITFLNGKFSYSLFVGFSCEFLAIKVESYLFVFPYDFAVFECCFNCQFFSRLFNSVFAGFKVLFYFNCFCYSLTFIGCFYFVSSRFYCFWYYQSNITVSTCLTL